MKSGSPRSVTFLSTRSRSTGEASVPAIAKNATARRERVAIMKMKIE